MTLEALQVIIKANINELTANNDANVNTAIDMAIKFLSNFFSVRKIDDSQTVSTGDTTISKPARAKEIYMLKIGDTYIKKADLDKLQAVEDEDSMRWHIEDDFLAGADNNIHLTEAVDAADDGDTVKIWYIAGFTPLAGVALSTTDLPEWLEPLLIIFATYFYYGILVSYVKDNKASFPDMTVWDVIAIWDTWRTHAFDLIDITQKQRI